MHSSMKFIWAGCLVAALFLSSNIVRAEEGADHPHMGMMKDKLGLTDDQKAKMKEIRESQGQKMKALRDQEKVDLDLLKQKVDAKASDAEIKGVLDKLSEDHKAILDAQEVMKNKMRAILTPMQQAKMVLGMVHRMEGAKGRTGEWKEKKEKWEKYKKDKEGDDEAAEPKNEKDDKDDDSNR